MYNRVKSTLGFLIVAFFISGASALVYQILWLKKLTLIFGSTTLAVATILASFMGGLALGSFIMAHKAFQINRVIFVYAILEICIGLYAIFIPFIFDCTDIIYRSIWPLTGEIYYVSIILRFVLVLVVLIIPTTLMGATLPLLVKYCIDKDDVIIKYVSLLYGINTLGAVYGAFMCGFYLLENFGLTLTNYIAVSLNFIAALIAFLIDKKYILPDLSSKNVIDKIVPSGVSALTLGDKIILWVMFLSGFTAMVYEVVWTRQLVLVFGSTTYAYTSILVVFLIGIALGSLSIKKGFTDNRKNIYYFALFELAIGLLIIAGSFYYKNLFYIYYNLYNSFLQPLFFVNVLLISSFLIFPVAAIFGILFPLAIKLFTPSFQSISERTGTIYSFNTLGCILGSVCSGFILIPFVGLKWTLILAACINILLAGFYLLMTLKEIKIRIASLVTTVVIVSIVVLFPANWSKQVMTSGTVINRNVYTSTSLEQYVDSIDKLNVVFYKEGYHSTVAVVKGYSDDNKEYYSLYNNGKIDASTIFIDMRCQVLLGYLPVFLTRKINDVLVVGMGSGITIAVLEKFPVQHIELVELEKAVLEARKSFSSRYGDPIVDKRLKVILDDARNYLRVTDKKYDIIISEPSNVWVSGVANLYTQDYYHIIKNKLKTDGILCQWMHTYGLKEIDVKSVIKALRNEFKYIYFFNVKTSGDFIFIATQKPIKLDLDLINYRFENDFIKSDISAIFNISNAYEFLSLFMGSSKNVNSSIKNVPPNTDDNSFLEFKATRDFFVFNDTSQEFNPLKCLNLLGGLTKDDVKNPPADLYKILSYSIANQLNNSIAKYSALEPFELPMYKALMLNYARKFYEEFPESTERFDLLGTVLLDNDLIPAGIYNLELAASKNSLDTNTYRLLAMYYNKLIFTDDSMIDADKALKYSQKAMSLNPQNVYNYFLLGVSYYNKGNFSEALKYFSNYHNFVLKNQAPIDKRFFDYFGKAYYKYKNDR